MFDGPPVATLSDMATIKAVVRQPRRDGTYNVKLRITYKRQSVQLPTSLNLTAADLTRSRQIKTPAAKARAAALVREVYDALGRIPPFALEQMDVRQVVAALRREMAAASPVRLDFYDWGEQYTRTLRLQPRTIDGYRSALAALRRFTGPYLDTGDITAALLQQFADGLLASGLSPNTAKHYIVTLAVIYRAAQIRYNDEDAGIVPFPRRPFDRVTIKTAPPRGEQPLPADVIQRIIDTSPDNTLPEPQRRALDLFVISFACMGMNLADLDEITPARVRDGELVYYRKKTRNHRADHAEMHLVIPPCIAPFAERQRDPSGRKWLRLWKDAGYTMNTYINRALRAWAADEGLPPFRFYAARHSWATLARRAGVEKATVDEALVHVGDLKLADVYIDRDWPTINRANEKVLAMFRWPSAG